MSTSERLKPINLKIAAIKQMLATMKHQYFAEGIEQPMSVRVGLEKELADLAMEKLTIDNAERVVEMHVRQKRGEILRARLAEIGFPGLIDECDKLARQQVEGAVSP